jgi:hypothetical protein
MPGRSNQTLGPRPIFSTPRIGQDIVVAAFRIFGRRLSEAIPVRAWHSPWPELARGMDLDLSALSNGYIRAIIDLSVSDIAQQLAHLGVGKFRLIDPQTIGATENDVAANIPKVQIAERLIKGIWPWAAVRMIQADLQVSGDLLKDAHVVFGCVDGYRQRMHLQRATRRFGDKT